ARRAGHRTVRADPSATRFAATERSCRQSPEEVRPGILPGHLTVARQDERNQLDERAGCCPERGDELERLPPQLPGALAARPHAQQAGVGELVAGGVLADALAGLLRLADHVEQVVGDLERQPQAPAVAVEPVEQVAGRPLAVRGKGGAGAEA